MSVTQAAQTVALTVQSASTVQQGTHSCCRFVLLFSLDYACTKAAIVAFTKGLSGQLAEKGIRVNCVAVSRKSTIAHGVRAQWRATASSFLSSAHLAKLFARCLSDL